MKSIKIAAFVAMSTFIFGCSSSSGGGSGGADAGNSSSGGGSSGTDAGSSSGGGSSGMTKVICYTPAATTPMCVITEVPSNEAALQEKDCTTTGSAPGTIVTSCPTQGLSGCCTIGANETCYYGGGASDNGCDGAGAVWTTTP
jgi:hypothetical protein